eukprot:TRINITY_DN1458_c0_g1_i1.p1 TRINITY_DN1458_c0_g1~~TRINITY_DN1458_c0_g1_i1.p1  ORF type:complete len:365 (+),score=134.40 TRINITY_DN1458_c0_g1_i1:143-1237(+)
MSFKIVYGDEIKRITKAPESFAELEQAIKKAFKGLQDSEFVAKYLDSDGDLITVSNEQDFTAMKEAIHTNFRIIVYDNKHGKVNLLPSFEEEKESKEVVGKPKEEEPLIENLNEKNQKEAPNEPVVKERKADELPPQVEEKGPSNEIEDRIEALQKKILELKEHKRQQKEMVREMWSQVGLKDSHPFHEREYLKDFREVKAQVEAENKKIKETIKSLKHELNELLKTQKQEEKQKGKGNNHPFQGFAKCPLFQGVQKTVQKVVHTFSPKNQIPPPYVEEEKPWIKNRRNPEEYYGDQNIKKYKNFSKLAFGGPKSPPKDLELRALKIAELLDQMDYYKILTFVNQHKDFPDEIITELLLENPPQ